MSRRSSRLDYTMTTMMSKTSTNPEVRNGNNGSLLNTPHHAVIHEDKNGEQETSNLITIEATQDMIKVESHQL